mmetsp:Transcript_48800/g.157705  ORF Transcript_48800/g.157705 Transcript_48800/m.157705 type:complete len:334 (-) Transcript_48800:17-1018(-)
MPVRLRGLPRYGRPNGVHEPVRGVSAQLGDRPGPPRRDKLRAAQPGRKVDRVVLSGARGGPCGEPGDSAPRHPAARAARRPMGGVDSRGKRAAVRAQRHASLRGRAAAARGAPRCARGGLLRTRAVPRRAQALPRRGEPARGGRAARAKVAQNVGPGAGEGGEARPAGLPQGPRALARPRPRDAPARRGELHPAAHRRGAPGEEVRGPAAPARGGGAARGDARGGRHRRPEGGLCAHLAGARRARLAARGGDARGGRAAPDADDAAAAHEQCMEEARARDPEPHAWESEGGSLEDIAPLGGKVSVWLARASLHHHGHPRSCTTGLRTLTARDG